MATLVFNMLTGILLWEDWKVIHQWIAYVMVRARARLEYSPARLGPGGAARARAASCSCHATPPHTTPLPSLSAPQVHLIMLLGIFLLAPTDSITIYKNEMLAEAVIDMGIDETADPAEREPTFKERLTQRRRSSVIGAHLHIGTPRSDLGTPRSEMGTPRTPGAPPLTTISSGKELVDRNSRWNSPGGAAVAHAAERRSHAAGLGAHETHDHGTVREDARDPPPRDPISQLITAVANAAHGGGEHHGRRRQSTVDAWRDTLTAHGPRPSHRHLPVEEHAL